MKGCVLFNNTQNTFYLRSSNVCFINIVETKRFTLWIKGEREREREREREGERGREREREVIAAVIHIAF